MTKVRTEKREKATMLVDCLLKRMDQVQKFGISEQQLAQLRKLADELGQKDQELEDFRAKVSIMSKDTAAKEAELSQLMTEIKKVVKSHFDPMVWLQFGVQDKR